MLLLCSFVLSSFCYSRLFPRGKRLGDEHPAEQKPNDRLMAKPIQCTCNPMRETEKRMGAAVVVKNEVGRLAHVISTLMNATSVTKLFVVDQGSTDGSEDLVRKFISLHGSRLSWITSEDTGYNELSSPLVSSLMTRHGLHWTFIQDADEELSPSLINSFPSLLSNENVDGYLLTRCNDHGYDEGVTYEHKTRLWRTGRAIPNIGFGTEYSKACRECWVQHNPGECSIFHQKTKDELQSDGERYHKLCVARCAVSSREEAIIHFPDCHVFAECADLFKADSLKQKPTPSHFITLEDKFHMTESRCITSIQHPKLDHLRLRVERVLHKGDKFLPEWQGKMVFIVESGGDKAARTLFDYGRANCDVSTLFDEANFLSNDCRQLYDFPREASYEIRMLKAAEVEDLILSSKSETYVAAASNFQLFYDIFFREFSHVPISVVHMKQGSSYDTQRQSSSTYSLKHQQTQKKWLTDSPNSFIYSRSLVKAAESSSLALLANQVLNTEATVNGLRLSPISLEVEFMDAQLKCAVSHPAGALQNLSLTCKAAVADLLDFLKCETRVNWESNMDN